MNIEPLEPRIAPAAVFTYTDVDGDKVTIKTSAGNDSLLAIGVSLSNGVLTRINLNKDNFGDQFAGTNLSVTVKRAVGGDGQAHLGWLDAIGIDLGRVVIKGDLGRIDAGDADTATAGVKSLKVDSMGQYNFPDPGPGVDLEKFNVISGPLGKLHVVGDFTNIDLIVSGGDNDADGKIGKIIIGGSLRGGPADVAGLIDADGDIGAITIKGDLQGGRGSESGRIETKGSIGRITIGGTISGDFSSSGSIGANKGMGPVWIGGNVIGGTYYRSGFIESSDGPIASVTIRGSLIGGQNSSTGFIYAGDDLGPVKILGDFIGGDLSERVVEGTDPDLVNSGQIYSEGRIARVIIGGSILGGADRSNSGDIHLGASIIALDDIGSIEIGGDIVGTPEAYVSITARGQEAPGAKEDLAIGKIKVRGDVAYMQFLAGFTYSLSGIQSAVNGDASIGPVKVGGSWIASHLSAGIDSVDGRLGNENDGVIPGGKPNLIARIARIAIGGNVLGTDNAVSPSDHFGFVAQQIGSFKAGGFVAELTEAIDSPVPLSPFTGDVAVREVINAAGF